MQFLLGFRISKNKYHDIHDHEREMIKTNYLKSVFRVQQNIEHPFIGVSDKKHLLFELKESVYKKEASEHAGINRAQWLRYLED